MQLTILLDGGPRHGERCDITCLRRPEAYEHPHAHGGLYYRNGLFVGGLPIYEWSDA